MTYNILEPYGFEPEIGGGGCVILSQYLESGAFIWVTCLDGGGLPDADDWMVCAYGEGIDDILAEIRSDQNNSGISLTQAVAIALDVANDFTSQYMTCRNGLPWADCECC